MLNKQRQILRSVLLVTLVSYISDRVAATPLRRHGSGAGKSGLAIAKIALCPIQGGTPVVPSPSLSNAAENYEDNGSYKVLLASVNVYLQSAINESNTLLRNHASWLMTTEKTCAAARNRRHHQNLIVKRRVLRGLTAEKNSRLLVLTQVSVFVYRLEEIKVKANTDIGSTPEFLGSVDKLMEETKRMTCSLRQTIRMSDKKLTKLVSSLYNKKLALPKAPSRAVREAVYCGVQAMSSTLQSIEVVANRSVILISNPRRRENGLETNDTE